MRPSVKQTGKLEGMWFRHTTTQNPPINQTMIFKDLLRVILINSNEPTRREEKKTGFVSNLAMEHSLSPHISE